MKALICRSFGPPDTLQLEEVPSLEAAPGKIVVSIKAAGVNFPDLLTIQGKYQRRNPLPFCPGMELAGVIKAVGTQDTEYRVGDRVCAHVRMGGAFTEEISLTPDYAMARIPPHMQFSEAAAFPLAYGTALEALNDRAKVVSGETVLVLGAAGGVGLAAVQIAKILGARVIACASSDERLQVCKAHGADELVNYSNSDVRATIRNLTEDKGVDVVCDQIGGPYTEPTLRGMALNGRYCVIGFASGTIPNIPTNLLLLKGCSIMGVALGMNAVRGCSAQYHSNLLQLIDWISKGKLKPLISCTYPLERAIDALLDMERRQIIGKAVITMPTNV